MNDSFLERAKDIVGLSLGKRLDFDFKLSELDSLSRAELVVAAEECCGFELTNRQILSLKTFGELVEAMRLDLDIGGNGD